jgi:hypothetical protein
MALGDMAWSSLSQLAPRGLYYAMRDQANFTVGVAGINRGALHIEARYNYEAHDAGPCFWAGNSRVAML